MAEKAVEANGKAELQKLAERDTSWRSIYIATLMMAMAGINMSILFMALWPYMQMVSDGPTIEWLGWIVAGNSLGCLFANLSFGWWAQKTMKTAHPLIFGFSMAALGNLIYAILPMLPGDITLPLMLGARILTGFCTGCLGVLRSFVAMCSNAKDRLKAMATLSTGLTIGLSIGPVIQMCFMPIGPNGLSIFGVRFNQYTTPGFFMTAVSLFCVFLLVTWFEENYVGIISDDEKMSNPWLVIPKFDRPAVLVMFYLWCSLMTIATSFYCVATPMAMSMYGWSSEEAVTYNALLQTVSCILSAVTNALLAKTRLGHMDRRRQLIGGLALFLIFMIIFFPWFFYPDAHAVASDPRVCNYAWCATRRTVPIWLYCSAFIACFGTGFPLCMTALNTRISEILGPRKQSFIQGAMAFTGSLSQFACPILVTWLYEKDGFRPVSLLNIILHTIGILIIVLFYRRLVPLEMKPELGEATKYKRGTFYRF